jgi:hypothetical protein
MAVELLLGMPTQSTSELYFQVDFGNLSDHELKTPAYSYLLQLRNRRITADKFEHQTNHLTARVFRVTRPPSANFIKRQRGDQ